MSGAECPLCHHPDPIEAVVWRDYERITTMSCCGAKFAWRVPDDLVNNAIPCGNCQRSHDDHRASDNACPLPPQHWGGRDWRGGYSGTDTYTEPPRKPSRKVHRP